MLDTCEFCGTEIDWEGSDLQNGTMWYCEQDECGKMFCEKCFRERHGGLAYYNMVGSDAHLDDDYEPCIITCPSCYSEGKR